MRRTKCTIELRAVVIDKSIRGPGVGSRMLVVDMAWIDLELTAASAPEALVEDVSG
jgi:hypothetical protein